MNYKTLTLTLLLGLATHTGLQAEEIMNHQGHDMAQMEGMNHEGHDMAAMQTEQTLTKGTITRLDAANGKVGIRHEAITNLKMPPMTMVFRVADPAQLQGLKVGDEVLFHAENPAGKLTVTAIQKR
ncbi:copper-binding protein [Aeromonas caviae]|uniref:copper-binding protein n=1 Tax=Aeromonas caviae TaxID=648 RepID=UPI001F35C95D|nr:copper-binding protein [Aeromonas caviae]WKS86160.1 copper-binding protein [Aeromonas caviae]BDC86098.1 secretion protein HlyD [Aeromonas caviae]